MLIRNLEKYVLCDILSLIGDRVSSICDACQFVILGILEGMALYAGQHLAPVKFWLFHYEIKPWR